MKRWSVDSAARITAWYLVVAAVWFFVTDRIVAGLSHDPKHVIWLETYNDWFFVGITALLLYFERRHADRESRQLAAIVASSDDAIVGAKPDGTITSWNEGACKLYGYSRREAVGRPISILFSPDHSEPLHEILEPVRRGQTVQRDEDIHHPTGNGNLWLSVRMYPIVGPAGRVVGISVTVRDITRRRRRAEALRRQAQIIDQIHDAVVSTDLEGRVTSWNRGAVRLYGYTAPEATGRHISFLYPLQEHSFLQNEVIAPLKRGGDHDIEVRMQKKSGEPFHAHLSLSLLRDEHGIPTGMIGYAIDITKRKRAEESLRMAEVGKLASGLVHEVRNPLNAMRMQIAIIRDGLRHPDEENVTLVATQLECLEHEVLRVQRLASDFLAYGRPSPDHLERIDPRKVLLDLVRFVEPEFDKLDVHVQVAGDPGDELTVWMDQDKLRQVLLNVLENAKQAMPQGGVVSIQCERAGDREVRLRIRDSGCGIAQDKLPRIFEAFYSTREEGTGLGLAMVKQTVETAGGRVHVESEVGRGTCFEVYLPRMVDASEMARGKAGGSGQVGT